MALRARRRIEFWKRARPLGDAQSDMAQAMLPAGYLQVYGIQCADPTYWAENDICQSLFPTGHAEAATASGCTMPDTASFQAKIDDLSQNWNPTGVYVCSDVNMIVGKVLDMVNAQHNAVMAYQATYDTSYLDKVSDQFIDIGSQATNYLWSCNAHWDGAVSVPQQPAGTKVSAPGLKVWVISAMSTMVDGMNALALAACTKPFWLDALGKFDSAVSSLWGVAKNVAGAVLAVGEAAVQAVENAVGFAAWLIKWAPGLALVVALAAGGTYFYHWNKKTRRFPSLLPAS